MLQNAYCQRKKWKVAVIKIKYCSTNKSTKVARTYGTHLWYELTIWYEGSGENITKEEITLLMLLVHQKHSITKLNVTGTPETFNAFNY